MKTKEEIVNNWLPRYTGVPLSDFGQYILLTNFSNYVYMFAEQFDCEVRGLDKPMQTATSNGITIINFGMGSPMAATVMDLLSAIKPKALGLLTKIGVLATGHFMKIDFCGAGFHAFFKWMIRFSNHFPVITNLIECMQINARLARRMLQRRHQ